VTGGPGSPPPAPRPACRYRAAPDLAVLTCYFNPQRYRSRSANVAAFARSILDSGITLRVVECAFGNADFELPEADHVIRVRARDRMWQKERLLNLGLRQLPDGVAKVAWLDCDVLFERADWAVRTSRLLDCSPVVQPFYQAFRLRPGALSAAPGSQGARSFAATHKVLPMISRVSGYHSHGHTGLAWAARRDVLEHLGLYDASVLGSGDHLMAHGFCGDFRSPCLAWSFRDCGGFLRHFKQWAESAWEITGGRLDFAPGALLHLWHGEEENRGHSDRALAMSRAGFDPLRDLRAERGGAWRWADPDSALARWTAGYFERRQEDTASA
jgi:hypothetical protein